MRSLTNVLSEYGVHKDNNEKGGCFAVPHFKKGKYFFCVASLDHDGWEHVSISLRKNDQTPIRRIPNYEEMCFIKSIFFLDEEPAIQIHAPKKDHINNYQYCLHLWNHKDLIFPDSIKVGIKELNFNN